RPEQVHKWIKSGRAARSTKIPQITNLTKYAREWGQWWDSLQPEWRQRNGDGTWAVGGDTTYGRDDEWGHLDTPGPNGCLSIVAGLFLWGAAQQSDESKAAWMAAVQDVCWMMEGLGESMKSSHKSKNAGKGKVKGKAKRS
ncbi:hypothetical protein C8R46DRAFT_911249, partial [Mycena filopes]